MSECPHLTGELVASYVNGLQNSTDATAKDGPLLTLACCKHYAIYNVETIPSIRTEFNAVVGSRDLWETYMPVFEACVGEGHGQSVMVSGKKRIWGGCHKLHARDTLTTIPILFSSYF